MRLQTCRTVQFTASLLFFFAFWRNLLIAQDFAPVAKTNAAAPPFASLSKSAISRENSFVLARDGEAVLYNYANGVVGAPFLNDVYKSFGLSSDSRYFLYLKADGKYPTFALYSYDLTAGTETQLTDAPVHYASWSPAGPTLAYLWLDASTQFHLSTYNLSSRRTVEIASGQLRSDFLEWSPDGSELLYISVIGLTNRAAEDGQFASTLHRYSLGKGTDTPTPSVDWAQYSGGKLLVFSHNTTLASWNLPNPKHEDIRKFTVSGGQIYANVVDGGREIVKRWNASAQSFDPIDRGQLFLSNASGIVIRQFSASGIEYAYIPNDGVRSFAMLQSSSVTWKIPFQGRASVVQGGQLYQDGSCDGGLCNVSSHTGTLGYAVDWQQIPENDDGNTHVLATADGTVAALANNVTCNSVSTTCTIGWDNYSPSCVSNQGAGNFVVVAHLDGSYSFYGHLRSGSIQVVLGQHVPQGTHLADQGHSGSANSYNHYQGCGDHLHFSRQVGPGVWEQSIPTDFTETPCVLGCTASYQSSNIELAPPPSVTALTPSSWIAGSNVQLTLTGQNFTYGSTVSVCGTGITVGGVSVVSPTRMTVMLSVAGGTSPGPYSVTVTSSNGTSNSAPFTVITPASGGILTGAVATTSGTQQLTTLGTSDWAHWGLAAASSLNRKAGVAPQVDQDLVFGSAAAVRYTNNPVGFTWTDGTPVSSATNTTTGISVSGLNQGFRITAPADSTPRTLKIYVGITGAQGRMLVQLSDGSSPDFLDTSLNSAGTVLGTYTITYSAASAGQTLIATYTQSSSAGSVSLQAAALSGGNTFPDFSISANPLTQAAIPAASAGYTISLSALSGFSGNVTFTVSQLPAGVTADFSPAVVTGSGTSTLTLTTAAATPFGNYPITIIAASGVLTHTANITLVVSDTDFVFSGGPANRFLPVGGNVGQIVTVSALPGFIGTVALAVSGLPAGVTGAFNPGTIAASGSSTLSLSAAPGTTPGNYPLVLTATSGTLNHTANVTLVITSTGVAGSLAGSSAAPPGAAQLTAEGTLDWAHWGWQNATDFNHKNVTQQISNFTALGGGGATRYGNNGTGFTWTDGTPVASVSNTTTGVFISGRDRGFRITAPADTTVRTLRVYTGVWMVQGRVLVQLSDGSAPDYIDTSLNGIVSKVFTFTYKAASSGQTLMVTITQTSDEIIGNLNLQAATLSGAPDFALTATPPTLSVPAGSSRNDTVTVSPLAGFSGTVGFSVSGLPAGATAAFNPTTVTTSGSSSMTVTVDAGTSTGSYPLTITATSGTLSHTANVTLNITPPGSSGLLSGSLASPPASLQLSTEGSLDWAHWGLNTSSDFNHKSGVTQQISNFTTVGAGSPLRYNNNPTAFSWTDGTPTLSASNSPTGLYLSGQNNGFRITLPADTSVRTLRLYVGVWRTQGRILAQLSDGSAADFTDTSLVNSAGSTTLGVYTFNYSAASSGQTFTVTFTQLTATSGNVTLQAATLASVTPDFSVSATPPTQTVAVGSNTSYTVTVSPLAGFSGTVGFSVSGLPAGATAAFNPTTVTTSGSSSMTVTVAAGTSTGSYPLTITATSGTLSHTANVTLNITSPDFSVSATPPTQTVAVGSNTSYTVTVSPLAGFSGTVGFSVSGLPAGATAAFNPTTVTTSGSSSMTVTVAAGTSTGSYPLTITATSGTLSHTANVTLNITSPDFSVSATPPHPNRRRG